MAFPTEDYVATARDSDEEFEMLFNKISKNCSIDEYVEVDNTLVTSEEVDVSKVEWRENHFFAFATFLDFQSPRRV